jgi:hypothetical protein
VCDGSGYNGCTQHAHELKLRKNCHFIAHFSLNSSTHIKYSLSAFFYFRGFHFFACGSLFSFNDLLIDDTPQDVGAMNALSNSSARVPNESSAEDELDDEGHTDEEQQQSPPLPQQQKLENGANAGDGKANILQTLLKQIHLLHETNSKLFRSLHETKGKWVQYLYLFISLSVLFSNGSCTVESHCVV